MSSSSFNMARVRIRVRDGLGSGLGLGSSQEFANCSVHMRNFKMAILQITLKTAQPHKLHATH